jgi:hypothetical protein
MNTGQTMITILALALLSVITMRYYDTVGQSGRTLSKMGAGFTATTIATSVLEQVENCAFDAYSDTANTALDSTRFTKPNAFGRETGETKGDWKHYDDVDDFNRDTLAITPGWMNEVYQVALQVYYVNPYGNIETKIQGASDKATYVKRIDVKVWRSIPKLDSAEVFDTVQVSNLHGYFFYNPM